MRKEKLAIIGASMGQLRLCQKAREMGMETYCFAWPQGAICRSYVDHFFPISITEKERIVEECRKIGIDGVVTNASESTALVSAYVAERLGLNGTPHGVMMRLQDKLLVRELTQGVEGLASPLYYKYEGQDKGIYPCVVKPRRGGGKRGVSFAYSQEELQQAITFAKTDGDEHILVEQYIDGRELSVESLSYHGVHWVIQMTDKEHGPAPHFVELAHHQPADISTEMRKKVEEIVSRILTVIGFTDGATHIEIKISGEEIYLIEVNLRGGGDEISNTLTFLSSGVDYVRGMIEVALNRFQGPAPSHAPQYAGIYYLCKQTEHLLPFFEKAKGEKWLVECHVPETELTESHNNWERNGWLIYKWSSRICP